MEGDYIYHFRVSAGVLVGETLNEGELSSFAVIHVPDTGKFISTTIIIRIVHYNICIDDKLQ